MQPTSHKLFDVWEEPGASHPWKVQVKWGVFEHDTQAAADSIAAAEKELFSQDSESKRQA